MQELIEITLDDGIQLFIEPSRHQLSYSEDSSRYEISPVTEPIKKTAEYLDKAMNQIKAFSAKIAETAKRLPVKPDEFEVEFSGTFSAEAGIIFTSVSSEASVTITLRWKCGNAEA